MTFLYQIYIFIFFTGYIFLLESQKVSKIILATGCRKTVIYA